ncbi:CPBP family intramembrane glutamic endopeptidase [Butyrivibrio proteoclasticus]|uniref:CPBP family intramembrane glutamic endopeptidase n=1 Tax=Butyrivibrio proteoclasticus TaxID=43305 RepID=UPI0006882302|nr:type II CAAX endopeptidase family protein [Butyrivibrio proteoclasticus]
MEEKKSIFKRIHTEKFKWFDAVIILYIITFLVMQFVGSALALLMVYQPFEDLIAGDETGFWNIFSMYFAFCGIWAAMLLFCGIIKRYTPIVKAVWTKPKGNNIKFLLIGLLIGFVMNMTCAVAAILNKDIAVYFDSIQPVKLIALFIAVFVQSSCEEMVCRGFLYQALRRGYRSPIVAIVGSSAFFAILHLLNPGVTILSIVNIFLIGVLFAMMVYYMDSLWCAMAVHAAWNYTQNIILGLPNSGQITPFSIFKLDLASARDSFAYSVDFGLEGSLMAMIVELAAIVLIFVIYHKKNVKPYDPWNDETSAVEQK